MEPRVTPIFQADAFTDQPFRGNPAAVCLLSAWMPDAWLQSVGEEMNLAETAFLVPQEGGFGLRWFTPAVEVDLCGHATLASAHVLWETGRIAADVCARFHTRSGLLMAVRDGEDIILDFPAEPETAAAAPPGLQEALGADALYVGRNRFDYLVEVRDAEVLRGLRPDMRLLRGIETRGVIVTCRSDTPDYDFLSRFFAPGSGIDEDPVTGSAHCCLGPFWQRRLGRAALVGCQLSRRGGVVGVGMEGERVKLRGRAVTVLRGELVTPAH